MNIAYIDAIADEAHRGQFRKFGGEPYVEHPRRVGNSACLYVDEHHRLPSSIGAEEFFRLEAVGLLHDVLEDTAVRAGDLLVVGVPQEVVRSVITLTRRDETYGEYVDRVILSGDWIAIAVKTADLHDNLRDLPLGSSLRSRYEAALRRIEGMR